MIAFEQQLGIEKQYWRNNMKRYMKIISFILLIMLIQISASWAQYYFGRNKVQYDHFKWHVLKTTHFELYFYPEMQELAEIGAAFAEESYEYLEDKFNHNINRRIPLIFYSNHAHFQQTNVSPYLIPEGVGGFFEFLKGRVVIPYTGSINQFKHVIQHELIHVFTHSKIERILKDHRVMSYPEVPLWFIEGIAEYWSEGWGPDGEMFIRDAVLNGYLFPLKQMYRIYGSFLMYKEGQAILNYISEEFGEEKILQLIENLWKEDKFSNVMKITIGLDYEEFDKKWIYHLKKKKYPIMAHSDSPDMIALQSTKLGFNTKPAFYRTDEKKKIVFISNRTGYSNIYMQPLTDVKYKPKAEILIKGERTSEFEAFHILKSKIDVNSDGLLTFVSKSGKHDVLYIYDIEERKLVKNLEFDDLITLSSPAWSPDGTKLVFSANEASGKTDLYIVTVESGELLKLTNDFYDDRDPVWAPNGAAIAFSSDRTIYGKDGFYNIFIFDLNSMEIFYATSGASHDYSPAWSPDGKYLTFTSDRDGAYNIWMLQATPQQQHYLALNSEHYPKFTSRQFLDDQNDIYHRVPEYPSAICKKNILKRLTNFTTGAYDPDWTDDGSLVFTAFFNYSMQIMELKNVIEKFEESIPSIPDSIITKDSFWTVHKLGGKMLTSAVKYKRKYNLDVAQSQITQDPLFGTSGGAQLAITDMLGNHQYYVLIFNNARTRDEFLKSFNMAVSRVDLSHRTNFALGLYHFTGRYYNYAEGFFWERRYGGFGAISYPFSTFSRLEGSLNIRHSDKEWWFERRRKALLVSNYLSYIKDNSLWGPTGPMDGERYKFTAGYSLDIQHSNVNFYTLILDYRKYIRLSQRICNAIRFMGMYNIGKEALPFFMGGSWDLRGYRWWSIWGQKLFLFNNELRFPFIDHFVINFPFGGLAFSSIRGATFLDIGNAWDNNLRTALGSFGIGIRWRFGGVLVLRFDYGKKFYIRNIDRKLDKYHFELQPGRFKQFFFGWDF